MECKYPKKLYPSILITPKSIFLRYDVCQLVKHAILSFRVVASLVRFFTLYTVNNKYNMPN